MKYICSNTNCLRINNVSGSCIHCDNELVSYKTLNLSRRVKYTLEDYIKVDVLGLGLICPKLAREVLRG